MLTLSMELPSTNHSQYIAGWVSEGLESGSANTSISHLRILGQGRENSSVSKVLTLQKSKLFFFF